MKIEIDTNTDSYEEWRKARAYIEGIYQLSRESKKESTILIPFRKPENYFVDHNGTDK